MEAKKQAGEDDLSMEEILQSIRRIIADDDEGKGKQAGANGEAASDILELTDMLEDDGSVTNLKEASQAAPAVDVLQNIDAALVPETPVREIKLNSQPAAAPAPQAAPRKEAAMDDESGSLLSKTVESATMSALSKLNVPDSPPIPISPSPAFRSGGTVEDLVEELLMPMMRDWLNNNLPAIVERIVEREVLRLTRR